VSLYVGFTGQVLHVDCVAALLPLALSDRKQGFLKLDQHREFDEGNLYRR
jgi:hypothetical protein